MTQKVVLITGAGSGMGQLAARRALASGWKVAALDVHAEGLAALGDRPELLKCITDITDFDAVQAAVADCEARLGPIDRLVNAAAIMPLGLLSEQRRDTMMKIMDINYGGLVNVTHAVLPGMLARQRGEFVSFASMAGHWPILYMGAYNASKHAVVAFTEVLHHENRGSGVRFVCVCPPAVATPLLQQGRDTHWPKMLDLVPPITPDAVLDDIERQLRRGRFWSFPGPVTRLSYALRRWFPNLLWWLVHRTEGR